VAGLGNPERPVGGLAVRTPPGAELLPLGREDLPTAVALAREARGLPPIDDVARLAGGWDALLNDADTVGFLALQDGVAAGMAVMRLRRRLNFATFEGWISDLAIPVEAPGGPLSAALVGALAAEWRLRGGHRILGSVGPGDDLAREALRGAGFEEGLIDFRLAPIPSDVVADVPGVAVRPVAAGDADAVTRLIAEFGPRRSPVPDRMQAVHRTFAAHVREVEVGRAASIVAELEGVVVGVCTLEWQRPFWADELHAWIPDLVVTEPVRGRGIGRLLLGVALRMGRDAGAAEVRLESGTQRAAAHGLYRSMGFVQTGWTWILRRED
jgi:GNAT superfamily N-acetyltransferase